MGRLYFVRHAIAEERSSSGRDADRALTADGAKRFAAVADQLARLGLVPSRILASPLVRARQTAEILRERAAPKAEIEILDELVPSGTPEAIVAALAGARDLDGVALVGHEPSASSLVAALVGARAEAIEMKKGGVAVIDFAGGPALGRGTLALLLAPKILVDRG